MFSTGLPRLFPSVNRSSVSNQFGALSALNSGKQQTMKGKKHMKIEKQQFVRVAAITLAALTLTTSARADAVTDWNAHWEEVVFLTAQPIPAHARFGAILHVAIFDAANGIARKYTPYAVNEAAPPGARQEAAVIEAAYTVLSTLYPSQIDVLNEHLAESLAGIPGAPGKSSTIARGREWGRYAAQRILELRSNDGWSAPPTYFGSFEPGVWRSIPVSTNADGTLPAAFAQNAILTPFAMEAPGQFRPGPPYAGTLAEALASTQYAADVNEVKAIGSVNSTVRTPEQTELARLWQAVGAIDENRAARSVVPEDNKLVDNARLFALLNMAACDALIASMDSKFAYGLWRPHHAIRLADTDGNLETEADPSWTALILAPRFPEYASNHASITGAFMHVLRSLLGDEQTFTLSSPNYPSFTWTFERCSDASAQVNEARIWAGIHFRHGCEVGQAVGVAVADYALENYLLPLH